jgi:hypothetical protein
MNARDPAVANFLLEGLAGEVQATLIEKCTELVGAGYPDHHGRCVGHGPEALLAFAQPSLGLLAIGQILHCPNYAPSIARSVARNVCAVVDMGPLAIDPANPVLAGPTGCAAANRYAEITDRALAVLGVDLVDPPLPRIRRVGRPA